MQPQRACSVGNSPMLPNVVKADLMMSFASLSLVDLSLGSFTPEAHCSAWDTLLGTPAGGLKGASPADFCRMY